MLESLSQLLIAIANGLLAGVTALGDVRVVFVVLTALGLLWLVAVEVEELDRQGVKPIPGRH
jgi:hypothetical protein